MREVSALNEEPVVARGTGVAPSSAGEPSRARRLFAGWSANLFQTILGVTQQVALVPVFLHFWTSDVFAGWLTIYAAGNLALIADSGLQFRAINRFFAFKSSVDGDGRTALYYAAMLRIYFGLVGALVLLLLVVTQLLPPSVVLGFQATSHFDVAFIVMTAGTLLTLPSNLVSGLYRARGLYGRAVWLQSGAMLVAQLAQLIAIFATGSLLAVTVAYVSTQLVMAVYLVAIDAPRLFPYLHAELRRQSWRWSIGQFRLAFPFAVAGATEIALLYAPVLLVSALVSDRVAIAQWGLTRVIAGVLRALCYQTTMPLAAELGHDYAVGQKEQLRHLYARGSVFVTLLASLVVSGLLPFWPDFFSLWTHGSVPYDPSLTITLMVGTNLVAPSILALGFANYSNRGDLLVRTKGLQLAVFLVLSVTMIPPMGPLGAAIAIVASDLLVQFGLLALIIMRQTLQHPFRHIAFLASVMVIIVLFGWGLGTVIRSLVPLNGLMQLAIESTCWLGIVIVFFSPLASESVRNRLIATIPT
jgi:O-antigen/teichoic acid export membrane protein